MIKVEIGPMCRSAFVSSEKSDWTLSIRKLDESGVGDIAKYHKEVISTEYLRGFLGGWETVSWRRLNTQPLFPQELMGECGDYQLNIILAKECKKLDDELLAEWRALMTQ